MNDLNLNFCSPKSALNMRSKCLVKWFKQKDGYGFVNHESVPSDIFLHESKIDHQFLHNIKPGGVIVCEIVDSLRGPQVHKIFEYGVSSNIVECNGIVKWFNLKKSFGFVSIDNYDQLRSRAGIEIMRSDIFVSLAVLKDSCIQLEDVKHGARFWCNFFIDQKGRNIMQKMSLQ